MEHHPAVEETLREFRSELCAELRDETDGLARAGLRAAIGAIDDITTDDPLPSRPWDPNIPTLPDPETPYAFPDEDENGLRYSPNQPRKPNGEFGEGDADAVKKLIEKDPKVKAIYDTLFGPRVKKEEAPKVEHPEISHSAQEAEANFKQLAPAWVHGDEEFEAIKVANRDAIQGGQADTNTFATMIREHTVENDAIYRGLRNVSAEQVAEYQVGNEIQIMPSCFAPKQAMAEAFASAFARQGKSVSTVLLTVRRADSPIHGVVLQNYVKGGMPEVVSGGVFNVISKEKSGGVVRITLEQTHTFGKAA
jgi:hypothetical protein